MPEARRSNRLAGHSLRNESAAFEYAGNGQWLRTGAVKGVGLCSCGAVSPGLESDNARKRWHREHKDEIRRGGPDA